MRGCGFGAAGWRWDGVRDVNGEFAGCHSRVLDVVCAIIAIVATLKWYPSQISRSVHLSHLGVYLVQWLYFGCNPATRSPGSQIKPPRNGLIFSSCSSCSCPMRTTLPRRFPSVYKSPRHSHKNLRNIVQHSACTDLRHETATTYLPGPARHMLCY
jgi:hypothetical protein